jgi:hypothetical protein
MVSKKTWILIITGALVFAGIVVALVFLLGKPAETAKTNDISVFKVPSDSVVGMKITQGENAIDLVKTNSVWHYRDESDANIDQGSTESALTMVCYLYAKEKLFDKVDDLSVYGLNPPQMQVDIELNDGSDMSFSFGSYTSGRDGVFMKYSGSDAVYVYDLDSYSILEKASKAMKDLSIDISMDKLEKIEIMRTSGSHDAITMVRIPDNKKVGMESWMVTSPFTAIANGQAVSLVTTFFASPRYSAYDGDDVLEEYGFGNSSAYIYLEEADGKSVKIEIGGRTESGRYYCKEEGRSGVYELASGFDSILEIDTANLIPSTLFPVSTDAPADISIEAGNVSYQLVKKDGKSYTLNDINLPEDTVKALFTYISEFYFSGVAGDLDMSAGPSATITLAANDNKLIYNFYSYRKDFYAVELNNSGTVSGYVKAENLGILITAFKEAIEQSDGA